MYTGDMEKTQVAPDREVLKKMQAEKMQAEQPYLRSPHSGECGSAARALSDSEIVAELFKYHSPTAEQIPLYAAINQAAKNFAEVILSSCPRGADRTAAIRLLRDARMTANAAIALNGLSL